MTSKFENCPICRHKAEVKSLEKTFRVKCDACGTFNIGNSVTIPDFTEDEIIKLKHLYSTTSKDNTYIRLERPITQENKDEILSGIYAPKNLLEKIEYVLVYIADNTKFIGEFVKFDYYLSCRKLFCKNAPELNKILEYLEKEGFVSLITENVRLPSENNISFKVLSPIITIKGLNKVREMTLSINSQQCFIAMWFAKETDKAYEAIERAVTGKPDAPKDSASYGAAYKIMKINDKHHNKYIPSEIISEIKRSKFMIADLTGYRGGVYYEAGYADGLGIPVILTCKEDWFDDLKNENNITVRNGVHFDLRQKNILFWNDDNLDEFQRNLTARIGEVVGFENS